MATLLANDDSELEINQLCGHEQGLLEELGSQRQQYSANLLQCVER